MRCFLTHIRRYLPRLSGPGAAPMAGGRPGLRRPRRAGVPVWVQFWHSDEEFAPRLRYLWDENALQFIRYETMWYAVGLLLERIKEEGHQ